MRIASALLLLALAACQKTEPAPPPPLASVPPAMPVAASSPTARPTPVLGWTTDGGDFLLLGRQAPAFTAKLAAGGETNLEKLRDHWTIVSFFTEYPLDKPFVDASYVQALNSAAGQDPDLDFLAIALPAPASAVPDGPEKLKAWFGRNGGAFPIVRDTDGKISSAFGVMDTPMYLLIGPDLTIEAVRGPLSETPDNGIKDVIRGVAEVKKQIANPT